MKNHQNLNKNSPKIDRNPHFGMFESKERFTTILTTLKNHTPLKKPSTN